MLHELKNKLKRAFDATTDENIGRSIRDIATYPLRTVNDAGNILERVREKEGALITSGFVCTLAFTTMSGLIAYNKLVFAIREAGDLLSTKVFNSNSSLDLNSIEPLAATLASALLVTHVITPFATKLALELDTDSIAGEKGMKRCDFIHDDELKLLSNLEKPRELVV